MAPDQVDLAGFAVGVVEHDSVIDGSGVAAGDSVVGLVSPGLRSNGFSLARAVVAQAGLRLDEAAWPGAGQTLGEALLEPSVIYAPAVLAVRRSVPLRAVAHVTGGGLMANLARVLPRGRSARVDRSAWEVPRVQTMLIERGGIEAAEAERVFNLGIGMVVVVTAADAAAAVDAFAAQGVVARVIGSVQ
jgi:phosphoribosylformylglycinamidine cyclo-ligase